MKRAFSLIELSIVILIIGILIAGVTQGSRLVKQFRLSNARSVTQSAPVSSIKGLMLWLEATSTASFIESETEDAAQLTAWYDINPQSPIKNHATRGTASANVLYEDDAINSLPAVYFSGTASTNSNLAGTVINTINNAFSLFLVVKNTETATGNWRAAFRNGAAGGWAYQKDGQNPSKRDFVFPTVVDCYSSSNISTNSEVISMTYDGTNLDLLVNGTDEGPSTTTGTAVAPTTQYTVGNGGITAGTSPWMGYIAEVIVFDRALKIEERDSIETYLGKKWGIVVN